MFYKAIETKYKQSLFSRCEQDNAVKYFSPEDFPGLKSESFSFLSSENLKLSGYFYYKNSYIDDRIVIFDHGFGAGHRAYMKEISMLCDHGYLVFSYDHTGCVQSEGEGTRGFSGSLSDLDSCLKALKQHEKCLGKKIFCIGHSWGGFSTLNISAYHPDIERIVVISGFVSVEKMIAQMFPFPLSLYRKKLYALEKQTNPGYAEANGIKALKNTNAQVLLIYSDNDHRVSKKHHFDMLKNELSGKGNIQFILVSNKYHNPNYTENAVKLLNDFTADYEAKTESGILSSPEQKKLFKDSYDWHAMTEQDSEIWDMIFDHFDREHTK